MFVHTGCGQRGSKRESCQKLRRGFQKQAEDVKRWFPLGGFEMKRFGSFFCCGVAFCLSAQSFAKTSLEIQADRAVAIAQDGPDDKDGTNLYQAMKMAPTEKDDSHEKLLQYTSTGGEKLFSIDCKQTIDGSFASCVIILWKSKFVTLDQDKQRSYLTVYEQDAWNLADQFDWKDEGRVYFSQDLKIGIHVDSEDAHVQLFRIFLIENPK